MSTKKRRAPQPGDRLIIEIRELCQFGEDQELAKFCDLSKGAVTRWRKQGWIPTDYSPRLERRAEEKTGRGAEVRRLLEAALNAPPASPEQLPYSSQVVGHGDGLLGVMQCRLAHMMAKQADADSRFFFQSAFTRWADAFEVSSGGGGSGRHGGSLPRRKANGDDGMDPEDGDLDGGKA